MTKDNIQCKVCKKIVKDDHEFICHNCVEDWRNKLIEDGKSQAKKEELETLKDIEEILEDKAEQFKDYGDAIDCVFDIIQDRKKQLEDKQV